jgi:APA family basic amino acid/polyamine antiporter
MVITGVYAVLFALNAFGVKLGARAIVALATLKLTPLFLLAAIGIWFVDWSQVSFSLGAVPSWTALGASMALVMFAYSGMETALVPSGELRDPSRNVPRATVAAILLVVLLYLGLQIVGQGVLGLGLGKSPVPVADTAAALWEPARVVFLITACISMTGFLMGNLLGTSRLVYALGRDGYLPRVFGRVSETHRVPIYALIAHAVPAWILAIAGSFDTLALISGGAICLVYGLVSISAWRAQRTDMRERENVTPFVLPGGPFIPALAVVSMVLIVFTLTKKEFAAIGVALAVLVAVYAGLHWMRRGRA